MKMLRCYFRDEKLDEVREKLFSLGVPGLSVSYVKGIGKPMGQLRAGPQAKSAKMPQFLPRTEINVALDDGAVEEVIDALLKILNTGNLGDGKIFVMPVEDAIRVRTGERGPDALY